MPEELEGLPPSVGLRALFHPDDLVGPMLAPELRDVEAVGSLLTDVGLPRELGDWFRAVDEVRPRAMEHSYVAGDRVSSLRRGAVLGHSRLGNVVLDVDSGAVVWADDSGETQLLNSSLAAFVYFAGEWLQGVRKGFLDLAAVRARLQAVDAVVLMNPEGIWSVMLEEVEAGLY